MKRLRIPLLKGLGIAFLGTCVSCSSAPKAYDLAIDLCVISNVGNDLVCRCVKPDDSLYSLSIQECAEKRYQALSPDDAAKLYGYLFKLKDDLDSCREEP